MADMRTILPLSERGAFQRLISGLLLLCVGLIALYFGNVYIDGITTRLVGRNFGTLLFGSVLSVLIHGSQVLLLLLAWVLIGRGAGYYFMQVELAANLLLSSMGIWATWNGLPVVSPKLYVTFPLNVYIVILLVTLFQFLTLHVENWADKGAAMLLWVFTFQCLELLPVFPVTVDVLSRLPQDMYRTNEDVAIASMAGMALFLSFMAGALTSTWLLARYSVRLGQFRQLWESGQGRRASDRMEGIREVSMVDLRNLVHDLKNPLAAVKGMAMILHGEAEADPKENGESGRIEKTEVMLRAANYMERMIAEILHEDRRNDVPVEAFVNNLEKHVCTFPWGEYTTLDIAPDARQLTLSLNEIRFMRALLNVIDNAWRANRIAGTATRPIEVSVRKNAGFVEIEIRDNGPGYFPEKSSFHRSGWGSTGLGLAFVRKVVISLGGTLLISQRQDNVNGTSVLISLPANPSA